MIHNWFIWMATAFVSILPSVAHSATYYVAKTGSDNHTCSQAQSESTPTLTIARGLACLKAADILIIKPGTYAEGINDTIPSGSSSSARTIIKANIGDIVTLQPAVGVGPTGNVVYINSNSYIQIEGLIIDGVNVAGNGVYLTGAYTGIRIERNEVKNAVNTAEGNCITVQGSSPGPTEIINNRIHGCGFNNFHHGVYVWSGGHLIERNEIYNNSGHGIHQYQSGRSDGHNNIMRYNYIYDNGSRCAIIGSGDNQLFHHNICANNGHDGIRIGQGNPSNAQVYNNTFYKNGAACISVGEATSIKVINNLCLSNTINTINNSGIGTINESNRLSTDNTLVIDAANYRFIPRAGSALIDAGASIPGFSAGNFIGSAPDQGALEFAGAVSRPSTIVPAAPLNLRLAP